MEIQADKLFFRQKENSKTKSLFPVAKYQKSFIIIIIILFFIFISFAIPQYNNYSYYHKAYMHKRTTHLSTRAIPQPPHEVCLLLFYKCYSKKKKLIMFVKEEKVTRLQSPFVQYFL